MSHWEEIMGEKLIISVSGLRGIVGDNLTPLVAGAYGAAFGSFLREHDHGNTRPLRVCIGRDSRPSGPMIAAAVSGGLCSVGIEVVDLGLVITPSVGIMLRELECQGGVMITASHNPLPYNGIKLILENGMAPPPALAARIKERYEKSDFQWVASPACGQVRQNDQTERIHLDRVLKTVDVSAIQAKKYKVVLDSVNGAGGRVGTALLEALGCEVVGVNVEPTGLFAHEPEPTAANLVSLCEQVRTHAAHIGFAQDPDADRLAVVDHEGRYLSEEYTLVLAAASVLATAPPGAVATNLSTSRMIDDLLGSAGGTVIRTPVGEAHVAGAMMENRCIIGGEGNGGVIDLRVGPIRDSLVAMALVLDLMAREDRSVQALARSLGSYVMLKDKFRAESEQAQQIMDRTRDRFPQAAVDIRDGMRLDFDDGWIHLRISNTEPVMRMIIEGRDEAVAQGYARQVRSLRDEILG
jgi:phosphomannomutase